MTESPIDESVDKTSCDEGPILVWFRRDLRLSDNPALTWAAGTGRPVIPAFILDEDTGDTAVGNASRWWLHCSLHALEDSLRELGCRFIFRRGPAGHELSALIRESGASSVVWNRLYDPATLARDRQIKAQFKGKGIAARSFNAALLFEPWTVKTGGGSPYRVFTPFWRCCQKLGFRMPGPVVSRLQVPKQWPESDMINDWSLLPIPDIGAKLCRNWRPGEKEAHNRLDDFLRDAVKNYHECRDYPGKPGTSRLSPHLHFGEIGPRQIASAIDVCEPGPGPDAFLREIGWREFSHHLLYHNPAMETKNLRPAIDRMPWCTDSTNLKCWRQGRTGYPLVDAGMRELAATGWMHNRVRMIAASFLTKHLLMDWRAGADWFLDALVDADRANNSAGWQWVAGSGADAAPYHRIFNPIVQSRRFDESGNYLRAWVPELSSLPDEFIHSPWTAPQTVLSHAGVQLGKTYPFPIVDHMAARERALAASRSLDRPEGGIDR